MMNYKTANRLAKLGNYALWAFAVACVLSVGGLFLAACSKDDNNNNGQPRTTCNLRPETCPPADDPNDPDGHQGPADVALGMAGKFAILAKAGVDTIPTSVITGDVGVSPIDQTGLTGFSETADASNQFSTSPQVTGKLYAADYAEPTPTDMTTTVSDMELAYTDAAGRTVPAPVTELGAGDLSGMTLAPGLYKFGTGVLVNTELVLEGGSSDTWIFQIAQGFDLANGIQVKMAGGANADNVFWQVFGPVNIGTTAKMVGTILSKTNIAIATGGTLNGRALAQTAVTLDSAVVTITVP